MQKILIPLMLFGLIQPLTDTQKLRVREKQLVECRLVVQQLTSQVQLLQAAIEQRRTTAELAALVESMRRKDCKTCTFDMEKLEWKK